MASFPPYGAHAAFILLGSAFEGHPDGAGALHDHCDCEAPPDRPAATAASGIRSRGRIFRLWDCAPGSSRPRKFIILPCCNETVGKAFGTNNNHAAEA